MTALDDAYEPALRELVVRAFARMDDRLEAAAPTLAGHVQAWRGTLSGTAPPVAYFLHERAFPMLLLPWWIEAGIRDGGPGGSAGRSGPDSPDPAFHADVVYSTLTGYYFVRMIDDLMDRERPPAGEVLPALIFFHTEFQGAYRGHFPDGHPFWATFEAASYASAEAASRDAGLVDIDRERFERISARKISGGKVPIAAVCHRYRRADQLGRWFGFVDLLGCWHQMLNDMLDWNRDLEGGRRTYFLSEASRQSPTLSTAEWVVSSGLAWGYAELEDRMAELLRAARALDCPPLVAYLEGRRATVAREWQAMTSSLEAITKLARVLR